MKYFFIFTITIILLIAFQFAFYRSIPFLGAFPVIKSNIVIKSNGEIILIIVQKGTYSISLVSLYYKEKVIYTEARDDTLPVEIKNISDIPKVKMPYTERKVYIALPKNIFEKASLLEGMVFNLECYGSFDQYFSASGQGFNIECKVIHEK